MIGKIYRLVISLLVVLLSACIFPIPFLPHDVTTITEHEIEKLISVSATRREIIERFGSPLRYRKDEISYKVCRTKGGVSYVFTGGLYGGEIGKSGGQRECHEYILLFDAKDALSGFHEIASEPEIDKRVEVLYLRTLGEQGDPIAQEIWEKESRTNFYYLSKLEDIEGDAKAMYRVYMGMRYEHIKPVAAWGWLCKAADLGYESAQIEVAYWHRESNWEFARHERIDWLHKANIRADDRISYLWYTLAEKGDDKRLQIRDYMFSETLSEKEIAEAKDMVSNWKPAQCPTPYHQSNHA